MPRMQSLSARISNKAKAKTKAKATRRLRAAVLETLENRQLLSASWTTYSAAKPSASNAPQAVMQMLAPAKSVGIAVDVQALSSSLGAGSQITSNYQWNFGDPSSKYNQLPGFNASHIYDSPGTYNVSLTVTNDLGKSSTVSTKLTIGNNNRKNVYVDSVHGNDSNNGSSSSQAIKTVSRATKLIGDNTNLLFARGESFSVSSALIAGFANIVVGAYGSGSAPVMMVPSGANPGTIFSTSPDSNGVTFRDIAFDSAAGESHPTNVTGQPMGITTRGTDISIFNCTFIHVDYAINSNSDMTGLTVMGNTTATPNSVSGYFVWDQAADTTIVGNTVLGSTHEHNIRTFGAKHILIANNNFTSIDTKGCVEIHDGSYEWISGNTATGGDIRVGPLGLWGESPDDATTYAVIEGNTVFNNTINVDPGSNHISIRNNIIRENGNLLMIAVNSTSDSTTSDVQILNNTGYSTGNSGQFLKLFDSSASGIILANNLLVQPALSTAGGAAAPVYIAANNLNSFSGISGNVWQTPKVNAKFALGGINFVATSYVAAGYQTPTAWNALPQVATDFFSNTAISSSFAPAAGSLAATADKPVAGVFLDFYGKVRSSGGPWSAGAVEVNGSGSAPEVTPPPVDTGSGDTGGALPGGWQTQDVGKVGKTGSATYSNGTYTLTGGGYDVWGTTDAFRYSYMTLNGDGQIVAQVTNMSSANPWSKVGVMIRTGTWDNASEISMLLSPNGTASFQHRTGAGAQTTSQTVSGTTTPGWVKLVRSGSTITGYISKDGQTWAKVGSTTIAASSTWEIGLAVTSHDNNTLETGTFSNVSVTT